MTFKEIELKEKELHVQFEKLKDDFKRDLNSVSSSGSIVKLSSNIAIVKSSSLLYSWSPLCYIVEKQTEELMEYLDNSKTVTSFIIRLNEILDKKFFINKGERVYLDNAILEKIKNYIF